MSFLLRKDRKFLKIIGCITGLFILCVITSNFALKHTNWYKNDFVYVNQIIEDYKAYNNSHKGYRVINLGSNSARYAFVYDNVRGCNWSTGTQGPDFDLVVLKEYGSCIEPGGVVFIPIVIFSSLSPYLSQYNPNWNPISYPARLGVLTDWNDRYENVIPHWKEAKVYTQYPILRNLRSWRYLFKDAPPFSVQSASIDLMSEQELRNNADLLIKHWMTEFDIKDLHGPLSDTLKQCMDMCVDKFVNIIDYCVDHKLKPYIVIPPISQALSERYDSISADLFCYSFVRQIQAKRNVPCLDYLMAEQLTNNKLYINALFLNSEGRKRFSKRVLKDAGLQ